MYESFGAGATPPGAAPLCGATSGVGFTAGATGVDKWFRQLDVVETLFPDR
jgi:hypothetical protein